MKNFLVLTAALLLSQGAFAYQDGTYVCKNVEGVPDNVYKIETVNMGSGISAPFLHLTRHFKDGDDNIRTAENRGFAMYAKVTYDGQPTEILSLGNISLEFSENNLNNCKKP